MAAKLSVGPILFHWPVDQWLDFYRKMADEADVDRVYLGEVVCSKRAPFYEKHYLEVAERLQRAGKDVVLSTLSEVSVRHDRNCISGICAVEDYPVEANDVSALLALRGRAHTLGPFLNVYNEGTLHLLALRGASHVCLQPELSAPVITQLTEQAHQLNMSVEVQVFGRVSLALSARCYHARKFGRTKDNCQYACEADPNGLDIQTLDQQPFLAVNGIQTLSYGCLNLLDELPQLQAQGVDYVRLSPQQCDMVQVAQIFRQRLQGKGITSRKSQEKMHKIWPDVPFINGFYHGQPGQNWQQGR